MISEFIMFVAFIGVSCAHNHKKNVLFLMVDDLRAELGAYVGPEFPALYPKMHTPNINALAERSLLLKRAYCQQAVCSPSRASLLTGRRPDTTHVYDLVTFFRNVGGDFTTIPGYFRQQGYDTIGMGKIFHPGNKTGNDDPVSWTKPYFHGVANFESTKSWEAVDDDDLKTKPLRDKQLADYAKDTLVEVAPKAKSGERNFFIAVGFQKPHLPFVFPKSVMDTYYPENEIYLPENPYAPVNMPSVAWNPYSYPRSYSDLAGLNASGSINTTLPDKVVIDLRRAYYSCVTMIDSLIGEVIDKLKELGLSNSTIISFASDHGYMLGEHGEWGKKTNFELATHAPMMIHIPGRTDHGIRTDQLAEMVDLFPTLVDAAGLTPLSHCPVESADVKSCHEGTSLMPLIDHSETAVKNAAFSQITRSNNIMGYTIRTTRYRYTEWVKFIYSPKYKANWTDVAGIELYDYLYDPSENFNRADDSKYENVTIELSAQLHMGWRNATVTPISISKCPTYTSYTELVLLMFALVTLQRQILYVD